MRDRVRTAAEALGKAPVLKSPDVIKPFLMDTGASDMGIYVVLSQASEAGKRVVTYYSRTLSCPERNALCCMQRAVGCSPESLPF